MPVTRRKWKTSKGEPRETWGFSFYDPLTKKQVKKSGFAKKAFATMSKIPGLSAIGHAGGVLANFVAPKKTVPGHALGSSYFQGGLTRINEGERGEALVLPSGTRIEPHDVAKKSSRGNITINLGGIRIDGNVLGNEEYANYLGGFVTNKVMLALANI